MIFNKHHHLIRHRETLDDLLHNQIIMDDLTGFMK